MKQGLKQVMQEGGLVKSSYWSPVMDASVCWDIAIWGECD